MMTFRPDDYVSEKAFLTMLLQAMDYEADEDFNWDTVLSKHMTLVYLIILSML